MTPARRALVLQANTRFGRYTRRGGIISRPIPASEREVTRRICLQVQRIFTARRERNEFGYNASCGTTCATDPCPADRGSGFGNLTGSQRNAREDGSTVPTISRSSAGAQIKRAARSGNFFRGGEGTEHPAYSSRPTSSEPLNNFRATTIRWSSQRGTTSVRARTSSSAPTSRSMRGSGRVILGGKKRRPRQVSGGVRRLLSPWDPLVQTDAKLRSRVGFAWVPARSRQDGRARRRLSTVRAERHVFATIGQRGKHIPRSYRGATPVIRSSGNGAGYTLARHSRSRRNRGDRTRP